MPKHRDELFRFFGFLVREYSFSLYLYSEEPSAIDNFLALFIRNDIEIAITRDRSQVFIDFSVNGGPPTDKEIILEQLSISRDRFPMNRGLWAGYEIQNQSSDLQRFLPTILQSLT